MPRPAGLLIDWTDVIEVAKSEQDLRKIEMFSFDLVAVATVQPGSIDDQYSITVDGNQVISIWDADDDEASMAGKLVSALNTDATIFRNTHAQGATNGPIDRKGANFPYEFELMSVEPWDSLTLAKSSNIILSEGIDGEPIRLGGRSRVLEFTTEWIKSDFYKEKTKTAQALFAAHRATQFAGPTAGQGTKASESYEGESMAWTMATNNPTAKEELLVTNCGKILNSIREKFIKQKRIENMFRVYN